MKELLKRGYQGVAVVVTGGVLLGGCTSMPLKGSQQQPQQAFATAYEQLYRTPNYAFSGQIRLDEIDITAVAPTLEEKPSDVPKQPAHKARAGKDVENQSADDSAENDFAEDNSAIDNFAVGSPSYDSMIQDLIKATSQRYRFNYSGVVDLQHKQLEIVPEFKYEARNMAGYVRVPVLVDGNDLSIYADFSAFSPWLLSIANEGKYSRFQIKASQREHIDVMITLEMLRDIGLSVHQLGDVNQFSEQELTAPDRAQGASRKIQFSTPFNPFAAKLALFMASNKERFQQQFVQGPSFDKAKLPALVDAGTLKNQIQQDPAAYQQVLAKIGEVSEADSQLIQTVLLDKRGRLLQSSWQVSFASKAGKKSKVKFKLNSQTTYSKFGAAQVSYQPKPGNWLDMKESMNNTLFGALFSKGLLGLAEKGGDKDSKKTRSDRETPAKAGK